MTLTAYTNMPVRGPDQAFGMRAMNIMLANARAIYDRFVVEHRFIDGAHTNTIGALCFATIEGNGALPPSVKTGSYHCTTVTRLGTGMYQFTWDIGVPQYGVCIAGCSHTMNVAYVVRAVSVGFVSFVVVESLKGQAWDLVATEYLSCVVLSH